MASKAGKSYLQAVDPKKDARHCLSRFKDGAQLSPEVAVTGLEASRALAEQAEARPGKKRLFAFRFLTWQLNLHYLPP